EERTQVGVGSLEEIIDDDHAIAMSVVGVLKDDTDPMVSVMKAPTESHADIGVLEQQIQGIKESVELLLAHPELYEEMGTKPPKGKTLLAKVVANQTFATFLCVMGSELIQKCLGDGPKLVRKFFHVTEEHAPSIVFIDETHAIGTKRTLNQLDGFDSRGDVKIEFSLPDVKNETSYFNIHTERMTLSDDVDLEEFVMPKDDLSGTDIRADLLALRECRMKIIAEDFRKACEKVLYRKSE
ncbi:6302_t:CDS:2, partial [Cetraspora pellucida]